MTVGETIDHLSTCDNYLVERLKINNEFINMVKTMLPSTYVKIAKKEEEYQSTLKALTLLGK